MLQQQILIDDVQVCFVMKIKGLRWYIITLIGLSTVINFIDRSAVNIMWPYIYKEFGIADADNKSALALITTFFLVAYALGQTAFGKIMDAVGTRMGMVYSIIGWSFAIAMHAVTRSLAFFNVFRAMLGFTEAGNWPGATKSNAEWFPPRERAIAQGIFGGSTAIGSVIAGPVIAMLFLAFGWRMTFVLIALLGLLWIIPWLLINKASPDKHPWITEKERSYITASSGEAAVTGDIPVYTWKQLLGFRHTWGILLARFFIDPVWWLFITWLPTFLKEHFLFDIKQIGSFSWLPYLLAAAGGIAGGYFSSRQIRKGRSSVTARKKAITIGCLVMLVALAGMVFLLNQHTKEPTAAMLLIGVTLFGFQFLISNLQTLPSDYFHARNVGTVAGMGGTAAVAGTLITTWAVPVITRSGGYQSFFVMAAVLVPLAWAAVSFLRRRQA